MLKLSQYDTKQTISNDVEDLTKISKYSKNVDILIMNIVQKYSSMYISWEYNDSWLISQITNILDKIYKLEFEIIDLKQETTEKNYDPYKSFLSGQNVEINSKIVNLELFLYSLDCLLDIHSTSTIFKELVLMTLNKKDMFNGIELWSGSWIFSLAWVIGAKRAWNNNINFTWFEQASKSIEHSQNVIDSIDGVKGSVNFIKKDIICSSTYDDDFNNVDFLIAEIFSKYIPSFRYDNSARTIISNERCISEFHKKNEEAKYEDPFFSALTILNKSYKKWRNKSFFHNVEEWNISLWPDVTQEHLKIKKEDSSLYLNTLWMDVNLKDVWQPFSWFESIFDNKNMKRWD